MSSYQLASVSVKRTASGGSAPRRRKLLSPRSVSDNPSRDAECPAFAHSPHSVFLNSSFLTGRDATKSARWEANATSTFSSACTRKSNRDIKNSINVCVLNHIRFLCSQRPMHQQRCILHSSTSLQTSRPRTTSQNGGLHNPPTQYFHCRIRRE